MRAGNDGGQGCGNASPAAEAGLRLMSLEPTKHDLLQCRQMVKAKSLAAFAWVAGSSFLGLAVFALLTSPSICSWLSHDLGEVGHKSDGNEQHILTLRVDPNLVSEVQVYAGHQSTRMVPVNMNLPGCRRVEYYHLVARKVVSSPEERFELPAGDYWVIALSHRSQLADSTGPHMADRINVTLDKDLDMTPSPSRIWKGWSL